ncbi:MAG TPA: hypothetical protein PLA90_17690 [Candidatus Sumerlaeota bacterium]|nr:hypothetical protein [Candidatus Sumerlaeota bacterium]HPS03376.1 hypothetical protein [Candidatus Sumerlaeota bacterium]
MICILSGIEVFVFFLLFVLIAGLSCFSWFHGQTTLNHMFDGIPEGGPVGYLLNIWAFLAIEWEIPAILILRKSFLLFRNYGAIGPDETKRIAFILGVLAWWYSYKVCLLFLAQDCIFSLWTLGSIATGWGTTRVASYVLSIAASRLSDDNEKPDVPDIPDADSQVTGETMS